MLNLLNNERTISTILEKTGIQNVEIFNTSLTTDISCVIKGKDYYYIGIDLDRINSIAEIKSAIYHELGHIATNSFYDSDAPADEKKKAERVAVRWAITHCVTFEELISAIRNGVSSIYELAEYFTITIRSAEKVLVYYRDKVREYIDLFFGELTYEKEV